MFKHSSVTTAISVDDGPGSPRIPAGRISVQMEQSQQVETMQGEQTRPNGGLVRALSEPWRFQPTTTLTSLSERSLTHMDHSVGEPSRPLAVVLPMTERKICRDEWTPLQLEPNHKVDDIV
jgi:hypothetical protein